MWVNGVTSRFKQTLGKSHTVVSKVEILRDNVVQRTVQGKTIIDSAGNFAYSLDGTVRVSRAAVRRTLDGFQILDVSGALAVDEVSDLLAPLQTEVRLYRGVRYWDATEAEIINGTDTEYVPIGTFGVTKLNSRYPIVTVSGKDRMDRVVKTRFPAPWNIKTGSGLGAELRRILTEALPAALADMEIPDTSETTPTLLYATSDYMGDKAYEFAAAAGWVLYVDPMGTFRVRVDPKPDPELAVATFQAGAGSMLLDLENELDADSPVNAIRATGEAADGTVIATGYAEDDDPLSLTYVERIGRFTQDFASPLLKNNDQANAAARTVLRSKIGISDTTLVTTLVDPTLDVDDVVKVVDPITGRVRYLVADDFPVGIRHSATMPINCRTVSAVL